MRLSISDSDPQAIKEYVHLYCKKVVISKILNLINQ